MKIACLMLASIATAASLSAQDAAYPPGVTPEIHACIQRGLTWLSQNMANDGSWRNSGGYGSYPAAMTGLAGMALVASGSTPTRGSLLERGAQVGELLDEECRCQHRRDLCAC